MTHYITALKVENFRSCKQLRLSLAPFVPLVGYNNAGKSNILSALEWLFKERLLPSGDYNDVDSPIVVEGEITGISEDVLARLNDEHRDPIREYLDGDSIWIRREQPPAAKKKSDVTLRIYHPAHAEYRANPRGIWNAIKALFPEPIRVGAMENAAEDAAKAKSSSTIGKLLAELSSAVRKTHATQVDRYLRAISRLMEADGSRRLSELDRIDESINEKIDDLFPGMSLKLHFDVPSFEDIFKAGTVKVIERDEEARDFTAYGHGAQRSIQMALIRHLADIKQDSDCSTTTLLLIDEPELYLHPFAIEQVRESLHALSLHGYQIVFSTHSAQMITVHRAQDAALIRKSGRRGTFARKRLRDALLTVLPEVQAQAEHLFALSQSTSVLFANHVSVTEGKTELRLIPPVYRSVHGKTLGQEQTALIEVGSVDSITKTLEILREMDLPARAVADLDYAFRGAVRTGMLRENDEDLIALKSILQKMANEGRCRLNGDNGLPTSKNSPLTAAEAFQRLAQEPKAGDHIDSLHLKLLSHDIWLWKLGAIEAHLGLTAKSESEWARFAAELEASGLDACCPEAESLRSLVEWLRFSERGSDGCLIEG